jgi:hypothetical protein
MLGAANRAVTFFAQALRMTKLKIENPEILAYHALESIRHKTAQETMKLHFTCEVVVILGGNIVKSGDQYMTTPIRKRDEKKFWCPREGYYSSTHVPSRCVGVSHPLYQANFC